MTTNSSIIPQHENVTASEPPTQMQVVETLIANKKKSSKKHEIAQFTEEWSKLAHEEGITNEVMALLIDGFSIAGAAPLLTLMDTDDSCLATLKRIRKLPIIKENNAGATLRIYVHLFALTTNASRSWNCINSIVSTIPRLAYNKEGKPFGTNSSTVSKYLLRELDAENAERVLWGADLLEVTAEKLLEVLKPAFEEAARKKKPAAQEVSAISVLQEWLTERVPRLTTEATSTGSYASMQAIAAVSDGNDNEKAEVGETQSDVQDLPDISQNEERECDLGSTPLSYDLVVSAVRRLERAHFMTESKLSSAESTIKAKEEALVKLKSSLQESNKRIDSLKEANLKKQQQIDKANHQITMLQDELKEAKSTAEARSEMISMLEKSQDQKGNEVLARIASKLKADYGDFKDYKNEPMTAELGEIVKLQLSQIFEILKSAGVKL